MSGQTLWELHSDPDFLRLVMPLPKKERKALEEDMRKFAREGTASPSKADVMLWICKWQIRSPSITKAAKNYLVGCFYRITKEKHPEIKYAELYEQIADKFGISPISVRDHRSFANHLDFLRQKEPELAEGILSGKYRVDPRILRGVERRSLQEIGGMIRRSGKTGGANLKPPPHTVKDMPSFDPDGPLMSLVLTIPSWVRILKQALVDPGNSAVSPECRQKLEQALLSLYETAERALLGIWEG